MKIGDILYFDHQATTSVDPQVFAEMAPYFGESFGNPHSSDHAIGWRAAGVLEAAMADVGALVGADADEVIFTSGATEANNLALLGIGRRAAASSRRRIIVGTTEHKSVLAVSRVLTAQMGFVVEYLPVDSAGQTNPSQLEQMLGEDVLLVSLMAVNNEIGTIQDLPAISTEVRKCGALFHCDAAQAPYAMRVDHFSDYADLISLSGHKFGGPKGIGALVARRHLHDRIEPILYGGGQQHGLRSGTVPVALCVGMAAASRMMMSDETEVARGALRARTEMFIENLGMLGWDFDLNGPQSNIRHPGNANVRFAGFLAHDVLAAMQPLLAASTGSACTSGIQEHSHVLEAIGLSAADASSSIRFSLGFQTNDSDVRAAVKIIDSTLQKLRASSLS